MNKNGFLLSILILILIVFLTIIFFPKTSLAVNKNDIINKQYLEILKLRVNAECLQDSQCSEGFECIENKCIVNNFKDNCRETGLSTSINRIKTGLPTNYGKKVITHNELPELLPTGTIFEIINDEIVEHEYKSDLIIGDNLIEKENEEYAIKSQSVSDAVVKLRISFSKDINFSSENIRGQALRVLGEEYIIGDYSNNSIIYLISENKTIKLEKEKGVKTDIFSKETEGTSVNMINGKDNSVAMFEIAFGIKSNFNNNKDSIRVNEKYIDPVFEKIIISFNNINNDFADIRIGGNC